MSKDCAYMRLRLTMLEPRWVEFTDTRGVLRCLKSKESKTKAQGIVFQCPVCISSPKKKHYCIFLFENAPPQARPQGRFLPSKEQGPMAAPVPEDFDRLSLYAIGGPTTEDSVLKPQDVCGWEGSLYHGTVSWRSKRWGFRLWK